MDNSGLQALIAQWESNAAQYDKRKAGINGSACHDGSRQLLAGLAAASRSCAESLRAVVNASVSEQTVAAPVTISRRRKASISDE